jgi:2',3'-cyclic-nucleotide 2'-phosphodiesterase (5'-nucleotidase family)/endonuclease/exonuclease/phosphatase family metal-dependent hydrolase
MLNRFYLLRFISLLFIANLIFGQTTKLHLVFTNDIHGSIHQIPARFMNPEFGPMMSGGAGAFAYVSELRQEAKQKGDDVLLLDGGNFFQGTPLGTLDGGETIIRWMNQMDYDALTPGLRDFDQGVENLKQLSNVANFPMLSGNLIDDKAGQNPEWLKPIIYKQIGQTKLAIIGLTQDNIPELSFPKNTEGLQFLPAVASAQKQVKTAKLNGADIIIMLAHLGIPYNRKDEFETFLSQVSQGETSVESKGLNAMELAHFVEGIDVLVTGGVAKGYNEPWEDPNTHTLIVQNYGNLSGIGHLELLIDQDTKSISGYEFPTDRGMLITLLQDDILPESEMGETVHHWVKDAKLKAEKQFFSRDTNPKKNAYLKTLKRLSESDRFPVPSLGKPEQLEIVTWNLEWFPAAGNTTLEAAAETIQEWGVDMVALQEIKNINAFAKLMSFLPDHDFVLSKQSSFMDQAIIYRKDVVTFLAQYEPFSFDDYYFAGRPPLMANFIWHYEERQREFMVVNMHLKCCGDGLYRRQKSLEQLHDLLAQYIENGNENIIVVGDWNDQLTDTGLNQSFTAFLDDPDTFQFATMEISGDTSQASYPKWIVPSILDHILYSKGFFDEQALGGKIQTLRMEEVLGSWELYEEILSDHRPVMWTIPIPD